jgi:hypothetical protein
MDVYISMDIVLECLHLCRNESLSRLDVDYSHPRVLPRIRGVSVNHMACVQCPSLISTKLHTRSQYQHFCDFQPFRLIFFSCFFRFFSASRSRYFFCSSALMPFNFLSRSSFLTLSS